MGNDSYQSNITGTHQSNITETIAINRLAAVPVVFQNSTALLFSF